MSCRHKKIWLIMGGRITWCYECGAFRHMARGEGASNTVWPDSAWCTPVGPGGENPWEDFEKRTAAWRKRMATRAKK